MDLFGVQPVAVPGMEHFPDKLQRSRAPLLQGYSSCGAVVWWGWNLRRPPPGGDKVMCGCDSVPGRGTFGYVFMDIYLNRDATVLRKSTREDSEMAQQGKALGHQLCLPEFWSLGPTWWVRRELTPAKLPL